MSDILSQSEIDNLLASLSGGAASKETQHVSHGNSPEVALQVSTVLEEIAEEDDK